MGRIRPLLQLFRVTTDAFTQAMETNAVSRVVHFSAQFTDLIIDYLLHERMHWMMLEQATFPNALWVLTGCCCISCNITSCSRRECRCQTRKLPPLFTELASCSPIHSEGFYQADFEQEVEQVISNVEDIEDHFPRYADAQTCAAAQAKAGDPPSTSYDLSGLYTLM